MATKKNTVEEVNIKPIEIKTVVLKIEGDSPLIMHAWSEKAKKMMLDAQTGKAKGKQKEAKNPTDDFIQSMYWLTPKPEESTEEAFYKAIDEGARFGFPATAFKQAAISAAYRLGYVKDKMGLRGAFFIKGDADGMIEIHSDTPTPREDMVKIGMGTADLRYRGEFRNWWAELTITYNVNSGFSLESIINAINAGGYVCGVGEWRVEKDGQFGTFHVAG